MKYFGGFVSSGLRSGAYFNKANSEFAKALYSSHKVAEHSISAGYAASQVAAQAGVSLAAYEYLAGKAVAAKAVSGFAPSTFFATTAVAPTISSSIVNLAFKAFTLYPTAMLFGTMAVNMALHPEPAKSVFSNLGYTAYNGAKVFGYALKGGVSLAQGVGQKVIGDCSEYDSSRPLTFNYEEDELDHSSYVKINDLQSLESEDVVVLGGNGDLI